MKNIFEVWNIGLNFKYVCIICVIHINKQNIIDYTTFYNGTTRNTIVMKKYSYMLFKYCLCKLISSWSFWVFVLFLVCSYLSAMFQTTIKPDESKHLYSCLTVFSNVSFGYIAGYIFYIVSDFVSNSKAQFNALQYIMLAEYEILTTIASFNKLDGEKCIDDFDFEYNMFKIIYCESNPYEKCGNEQIRLLANIKIHNSFAEQSKRILEQTISYFDCLLIAQNKFLSYEEFECLTKIKRFFSMDNKNIENGCIVVRQFEIDEAFQDYYDNKKIIAEQLIKKAVFCVDEDFKQEIKRFCK